MTAPTNTRPTAVAAVTMFTATARCVYISLSSLAHRAQLRASIAHHALLCSFKAFIAVVNGVPADMQPRQAMIFQRIATAISDTV